MAVHLIAGEKITGEPKTAIAACNDYLRMGPARSLRKLLESYQSQIADKSQTKPPSPATLPPTAKWGTLSGWSTKYHWVERAEIYDTAIEAEKVALEKANLETQLARRKAIMQSGVALDFERVDRLKRMVEKLEAIIFYEPQIGEGAAKALGIERLVTMAADLEGDNDTEREELSALARMVMARLDPNDPRTKNPLLWAQDVKGLAGGRTVDIVRFNSALLDAWRAMLDDIAKETGGRKQRTINEDIDYSKMTEDQLKRVAAGEDPIQVILSDYIPGNQG